MPKNITDSLGVEQEMFTKEELDAQKEETKTEAVEEFKKENPDKTEELEGLQKERDEANAKLQDANDQLKGFEDKDLNFANLRKQKEDADTQKTEAEARVKEIGETMDEKIKNAVGTSKKEILEDVMQDHYNETVKALVGEDAEMKKKVEFHYARIADVAGTKEEMTKKLSDAYLLATGTQAPDALNTAVVSSGTVSPLNVNKESQAFSPDEKDLAGKFGLTDDDLKKHGN